MNDKTEAVLTALSLLPLYKAMKSRYVAWNGGIIDTKLLHYEVVCDYGYLQAHLALPQPKIYENDHQVRREIYKLQTLGLFLRDERFLRTFPVRFAPDFLCCGLLFEDIGSVKIYLAAIRGNPDYKQPYSRQ